MPAIKKHMSPPEIRIRLSVVNGAAIDFLGMPREIYSVEKDRHQDKKKGAYWLFKKRFAQITYLRRSSGF